MEAEFDMAHSSLNWLAIWRLSFFHPTFNTFSRIANDPKASIKWGIIWVVITALLVWFLSPQRVLWGGIVADTFGPEAIPVYTLIEAFTVPIFGVVILLISAAIAHNLARLFRGAGTYTQLVFCWAVMQLPFLLVAALIITVPSLVLLLSGSTFSTASIVIHFVSLIGAALLILYLFYAQVIGFSAIEKFNKGKGFGILLLSGIFVAVIGWCLSFATRFLLRF